MSDFFCLQSKPQQCCCRCEQRRSHFPYLIARDLVGEKGGTPTRFIIDFGERDLLAAQHYTLPFAHVKAAVLPDREKAAAEESKRNQEVLAQNPRARVNNHHANFLNRRWKLSYRRADLMNLIAAQPR